MTRLFDLLLADPTSDTAPALARAVFADLERRARPTAAHCRQLVDHEVLWWNLGYSARARALLDKWRRATPRARGLDVCRARFAARTGTTIAFAKARDAAAPLATRLVLAGDPEAALAIARAHHWFASRPDPVVMFVGWAFALTGAFAEGARVLALWQRRAADDPLWLNHVLKAEALLAHHAYDYTRELRAYRAVHALCVEHGIGIQRVNVEVPLAATLARNDEPELARALIARWASPAADYVPLDAGRDLSRAEVELLAGEWDEAERAARRACALFDAADMLLYACWARFLIALAAPAARFGEALEQYRRVVQRTRMPIHRARLLLLERLAARGMRSVRDQTALLRSRFEARSVSIVASVIPRSAALAADLYWDQLQRRLWLAGKGPFSLDEHPVLERMLEQIVSAREYTLALDAMFEAVWHMPYNPLVHESKLHVTIHRLRGWLDDHASGLGRAVVVRDGAISIADGTSVVVLEEPPNLSLDRRSHRDRLLACLAEAPLSAQELERRLGISRTTLLAVTRELLAEGAIVCSGRGRALRYARR